SFGLVVTMLIALKYLAGVPIPGQTALMSLDDKFLYIGWSMLVMGLVALAEWDALALDARDASILGPLPIPGGVIFRAKATALLQAALVVFFVTTLCLMPGVSNRIGSVHTAPERISYAMPPLWFLGLYETAAGHVLDDLPRTGVPRRLLAAETRATEIYRSRRAAFHQLASIALAALALVTLVAAAAYSVNNRQLPSPVSPSQALPHRVRRWLVRLPDR